MARKKGSLAAKEVNLIAVIILIIVAVIFSALVTSAVVKSKDTESQAAKPSSATTAYGTCSVSPNPATLNTQFTINGTSFKASQFLQLRIDNTAGTSFVWTQADTSGNFAQVWQSSAAGSHKITVYDAVSTSRRKTVLTTCSVLVN